jgi:hypothetical protein
MRTHLHKDAPFIHMRRTIHSCRLWKIHSEVLGNVIVIELVEGVGEVNAGATNFDWSILPPRELAEACAITKVKLTESDIVPKDV